jgi:hypothetical protein
MRTLSKFSIGLIALAPAILTAFDARYSPSELSVTWPASEAPLDKPAIIFSHPVLGETNIMTGTVAVNGNERPFLAKLDDAGNVEWSKRMPFSGDDSFDGFSLTGEAHLFVSFNEGDPQNPTSLTNRIGSFNPSDGFSARYTFTLPPAPIDPLNPFSAGSRSFQAQRDGKLAIIQIEGTDANVLLLNESGDPVFAKTYSLPAGGGGSPFPIPGFGLSYNFVTLTEMENGDFYLSTNGADLLAQTVKAVALRLSSTGDILWQRTVDLAGTTAFVNPRLNDSVLISGNGFGMNGLESSVLLLDENGNLQFATTLQSTLINGFSFEHFSATGNILLQGSLAVSVSQTDFLADGVAVILDGTGAKVNEVAYDLGDFDALAHIGTIGESLYFELFGIEDEVGSLSHGVLAKSDNNLGNWITRSYLEIAGPTANFSSFFGGTGSPYLTYRDADPDWINVSRLDENLEEIGDCEVLTDTVVEPYDPNVTLINFTPNIAESGITVSTWENPPVLTDDPFALEDNPFTVEFTCGNTGGGGGEPGILTAGEWTRTDFGWVFGLTDDWGISTYLGYVYTADFPYVYQTNLGWMYLVSSDGDNHIFYTWDQGYILINEGFGGFYYVYATDDYTQQIPQP